MAKKIFVIEDDHSCETVLKRLIHSIDPNNSVDWVESAEEAMEILSRTGAEKPNYNLIIADIFLAGESTGIDLWMACRNSCPETPVLITSVLPIDRFFTAIGRDDVSPPFLPKPFTLGECKQVIEGLLSYT